MRTLLVYPPFHRLHGLKNRFFPLGLGYLAGALEAAGQEVAIYNAENFDDTEPLLDGRWHSNAYRHFERYQRALDDPAHYVWREARDVITRFEPDLVGITTKSCMVPSALVVSRLVKETNPRSKIVWGGPHASISPDECASFEHVDFVVRHEGEQTIVDLVRALEEGATDLRGIDGLVWKDPAGAVVRNRPRMNLSSLDAIPFPDRSADLMPTRYAPDDYGVLFASRGCPWPCTFCASRGIWTRSIRYRSPESVVREMEGLYERYGVRDFSFWDDTFTPNRRRSHELFDQIIAAFPARGRPITWQATTRCDCIDVELARKMRRSGCRLISFGIESGSERLMKILRKGITHDKVASAQRAMREAGVPWDAFFMIGFPDDTAETIEESMRLIRRLDCRSVCVSIFTPYPGSELYERAKSYGLVVEPVEWRYFSHQSPRNHFIKDIPREAFSRIASRCLREIDRLNFRRYWSERVRAFATDPRRLVEKVRRMIAGRLARRALGEAHSDPSSADLARNRT